MVAQSHASVRPHISLTFIAWAVMLAASSLPNALFDELAGASPAWLTWAKIGLFVAMAAVTFLWKDIRPLRNFFLIILTIYGAEEAIGRLRASAVWHSWFGNADHRLP